MNVLLIEDPYVAIDVNQLDDKLDHILEEILEKEAWSIFDNDEDYDPEFEEEWENRSNMEDVVISMTTIPIDAVKAMSDKELQKIIDSL